MGRAFAKHRQFVFAEVILLVVSGCAPEGDDLIQVIGHRGAPRVELENSLASFRAARDMGADGVELDVGFTSDGHSIVMHDRTLDRTTTCSGNVRDHTWRELHACKLQNGEPIRSLHHVLEEITPWFRVVFVEVIADGDKATAQADHVAGLVLRLGVADKVIVSSNNSTCMARLALHQAQGLLIAADMTSVKVVELAHDLHTPWILMPLDAVAGDDVCEVRRVAQDVAFYGVDNNADFARARRLGARVIMTERIKRMRALVDFSF